MQNIGHGPVFPYQGEDRKLVLQQSSDPLRAVILDPKPPPTSLHKSTGSIPRYSVVPEALPTPPPATHSTITGSSFVPINQLNHAAGPAPHLSLPGPSVIATTPPILKASIEDIRALCPLVKHVSKYCDQFHLTTHALYPVDIGIPHVRELSFQYIHGSMIDHLIAYIETRNIEHIKEEITRLALLCASVAAGIQVSDMEEPSRKTLLRQYAGQAMKLLRMADAQTTASLAAYPVLLIVSRIIQDELEPILSWSLLGSVKRMAQMYAMTSPWTDRYPHEKRHLRDAVNLLKVRQRQESFLALMLGQSQELERGRLPNTRAWSNASYLDCLDVFAAVAAYCGSEDISHEELLVEHADAMQELQPLERYAQPHLADRTKCQDVPELTQYCVLRIHECLINLHYCQIIMAACRRISNHQDEYFRTSEICQSKARECVDTYLDMLAFSIIPLRNWILTASALRAALILGVLLAESNHNVAAATPDRQRLQKLIAAFTTVHDETQADRSRWVRRYPAVFRRLQEMCELSAKPSGGRSMAMNGASESSDHATALHWMSRDDKDDIMMPSRMVRAYFAIPSPEDLSLGSILSTHQTTFEI